jgi:hypothetical protein
MSRRLSTQTKLDIAHSYAKGRPVKVIFYEFGITSKTLSKIVKSAGLPFRHRYSTRNDLTTELEVKARDLFRSGRDTLTIARLLRVTEAKVANALARLRDRGRAA